MLEIIKARFWSFTVVVGVGFLLLVSLGASAWLAAFGKFFSGLLPLPPAVMQAANALLSFVVIGLMFAVIYGCCRTCGSRGGTCGSAPP